MLVSVKGLCRWCLVFVCVRVVEVVTGSAGGGAGGAIAGSVAGVLVVVPPGLGIVVELAAGAPGSALVLVVVVVCATAISGSAERAMARVGTRMVVVLFSTRSLLDTHTIMLSPPELTLPKMFI